MRRFGTASFACLALAAADCAPAWRASADTYGMVDGAVHFRSVGPTAAMDFAWSLKTLDGAGEPRLIATIGRCRVIEDDDGLSGLVYPATTRPADPPAVRQSITTTAAEPYGGAIDLVRAGDKHLRLPEPGGQFGYVLMMPLFIAQPFDVLADRLAAAVAAPGPVPPALVELARDLADCPSVGVAGDIRGASVFTCQLSLTDAGRAKLRTALATRAAATTRP